MEPNVQDAYKNKLLLLTVINRNIHFYKNQIRSAILFEISYASVYFEAK